MIKINIFFLDKNTKLCAQYHVDRHAIKMILEYSQLLSTAHRILDGIQKVKFNEKNRKTITYELPDDRNFVLYKNTHHNHPSAIWVRQSNSNYTWLHSLLVELCSEYTYRYGRVHKCQFSGLVETLKQLPNNISKNEFTEPTPAMPKELIVGNDSLISYRNYYIKAKTHLASWKNRPQPTWYVDGSLQEIINS